MTVQPAVTTCSEESCQREYRLGKETHVVFTWPEEESFFGTTCPFCGKWESKNIPDPDGLRQSLEQCNNFSPANRVRISDLSELESLDGLLPEE